MFSNMFGGNSFSIPCRVFTLVSLDLRTGFGILKAGWAVEDVLVVTASSMVAS